MAPSFSANVLYNDEPSVQLSGLDSRLSAMAFYPYPYLPILENAVSAWLPTLSDETGKHKRLKRTTSLGKFLESSTNSRYSGGSISSQGSSNINRPSSTNSFGTIFGLAPKDTWQLKLSKRQQQPGETKEGGNLDGMRLVQLLISRAEAVATSHVPQLYYLSFAQMLVFGSSFRRVASCFVQGLTDRLALVQPLGTVGLTARTMSIMYIGSEKKQEALRLVYMMFAHISSLVTLLETGQYWKPLRERDSFMWWIWATMA